jgi:hypothetical protein
VANPVSSVSIARQVAQTPAKGQIQDATPAPKQHVIPQDSVSISQSGKAASQALAASKSAQPSAESETSGDAK